jgi:hypothetical protein
LYLFFVAYNWRKAGAGYSFWSKLKTSLGDEIKIKITLKDDNLMKLGGSHTKNEELVIKTLYISEC